MIKNDKTSEGLLYIIMKKIGDNLKNLLRKSKAKRFGIKTCLYIGIQILDRI